jgi:thiamine biosynthesis protein ThiS
MQIKLNGKLQSVEKVSSLEELVRLKRLVPGRIIVEHNGKIIPCALWEKTVLAGEDTVEIVSFVGGG